MKGISRRARTCAVVAVTGVAVLAGSSAASAQFVRSERAGNGVPTGQLSTIMFNYGTYLNNGGSTGANATTPNPVTGVSTACLTSTTNPCRWERLEQLFAFFQRKGVTGIELFGHSGYPADTNIDGDTANPVTINGQTVGSYGLKHYRLLLDKYGLHAGGRHGTVNDVGPGWTSASPRRRSSAWTTSARADSPHRASARTPARSRTAQTLNRLGKESVESGVGPVYIHNHQGEFTTRTSTAAQSAATATRPCGQTGSCRPRLQVGLADPHGAHRPALRRGRGRRLLGLRRPATSPVTPTAALINAYPTRVKLVHVKDGINVDERRRRQPAAPSAPARSTSARSSPPPANRVRYYHHEQDSGTLVDADISFSNLKGTNAVTTLPSQVKGALRALPTSFPSVLPVPPPPRTSSRSRQNSGDAPLTITAVTVAADQRRRRRDRRRLRGRQPELLGTGNVGPLAAGKLAVADDPATPANEAAPPSRAARASSTSASSRRARTTRRSPACSSPSNRPTTRAERRSCSLRGRAPATPSPPSAATSRACSRSRLPTQRSAASARSCRPIARNYDTALAATVTSAPPATRRCRSPTRAPSPPATWSTARSRCRSRSRPRAQRRQPDAGVRAAGRDRGHAAEPAHLHRPDHPGPGHDRLPPGDRRHRRPALRHLQQDADVHAVDDDAVELSTRSTGSDTGSAGRRAGAPVLFQEH